MAKKIYIFILVSILCLSSTDNVTAMVFQLSQGTNKIYVSPTGSDTNECIFSAPCKTFSKALEKASSGSLIIIQQGVYSQDLIISKSNIIIEGVNATILASKHGVEIKSTVHNVTVRNLKITGSDSHAILIQGQGIIIENNTVHHSVLENGTLLNGEISCRNDSWGSAIKVGVNGTDVVIRSNKVYENCGEGIAVTRGSHVRIEDNTVYDNKSVNIYIDNSFDVQVINNNVFCSKVFPNGIALGEEDYPEWGAQLSDIIVTGNQIENCYTGIIAFQSNVNGVLRNVTIKNNYIPTAQRRGFSLDNSENSNVLVQKNIYFNDVWIRNPQGVVLVDNTTVDQSTDHSVITFQSMSNSGWIIEDIQNSGKAEKVNSSTSFFSLGDNSANKQYLSVIRFNTSTIPDTAVIWSMLLKLKAYSFVGENPFNVLSPLRVEINSASILEPLDISDFRSQAQKVENTIYDTDPDNDWFVLSISDLRYRDISQDSITQLRLQFTKSNDNLTSDSINFYGGNAPISIRPKLIIKYYIP
ncbi:MAG: right-handed parallel beta-helix repeat-containing protein [Anaerolineales bacterium]